MRFHQQALAYILLTAAASPPMGCSAFVTSRASTMSLTKTSPFVLNSSSTHAGSSDTDALVLEEMKDKEDAVVEESSDKTVVLRSVEPLNQSGELCMRIVFYFVRKGLTFIS